MALDTNYYCCVLNIAWNGKVNSRMAPSNGSRHSAASDDSEIFCAIGFVYILSVFVNIAKILRACLRYDVIVMSYED